MSRWRNIYLPLLLVVVYIISCYILSVIGPIKFSDYDWGSVGVFLAAFCVIFSAGFALGVRSLAGLRLVRPTSALPRPDKIFKLALLAIGALYTCMTLHRLATTGISYSLEDAGRNYINLYSNYERNSGSSSLSFLLFEFLQLPTTFLVVMGFYYFSHLRKFWKSLFLLFLACYITHYVFGAGKQKQLGDLAIMLAAVVMIKLAQSGKPVGWKPKLALAVVGLIGLLAFAGLLNGRYAAAGIGFDNFNIKAHPLMSIDPDNWLFALVGEDNGFPLAMFSSYFTNGYYGLSLAMQLDFHWTSFIGNSYSLMVIFERFLGFDFLAPETYPYRVGEVFGWDQSKWHSGFAWLASDFTFPGTLLLFGPLGYLWGKLWVESVALGRPSSIVLFGMLLLGLAFIPANNQLVHSPGSFLAFYSLLAYVLFIRPSNRQFLRRRPTGKCPSPDGKSAIAKFA